MTDMERRLIEIQSILDSLLHRVTPDGDGDVATILQWEGTLTDAYQTIDVTDFGKVAGGMLVSEDPTKRDFWNLVCEYAGEFSIAEGTSETSSQFGFSSTGAYAEIAIDTEEGTVSAMGHTEDGDPIDVKFYSIF